MKTKTNQTSLAMLPFKTLEKTLNYKLLKQNYKPKRSFKKKINKDRYQILKIPLARKNLTDFGKDLMSDLESSNIIFALSIIQFLNFPNIL